MTTNTFLYEVRCPTCHRRVGVSGTQKWGAYCDEFCAQDIPAAENEQRDAILEAIYRDTEWSPTAISKRYNLSRQRLYQLIESRDLRKAVR